MGQPWYMGGSLQKQLCSRTRPIDPLVMVEVGHTRLYGLEVISGVEDHLFNGCMVLSASPSPSGLKAAEMV